MVLSPPRQHVRDRGAGRAGAAGERLADAAGKMRARIVSGAVSCQKLTLVRLGKMAACSMCGPRALMSIASGSGTRIAHCGFPIATCWKRKL